MLTFKILLLALIEKNGAGYILEFLFQALCSFKNCLYSKQMHSTTQFKLQKSLSNC